MWFTPILFWLQAKKGIWNRISSCWWLTFLFFWFFFCCICSFTCSQIFIFIIFLHEHLQSSNLIKCNIPFLVDAQDLPIDKIYQFKLKYIRFKWMKKNESMCEILSKIKMFHILFQTKNKLRIRKFVFLYLKLNLSYRDLKYL